MYDSIDVRIEYVWTCPYCCEKSWCYRMPEAGEQIECENCSSIVEVNSVSDDAEDEVCE